MRYPRAVTRVALLAVAVALVCPACTSGPAQSRSSSPPQSSVPPVAHPLLTKLQETDLRFAHPYPGAANATAVTVLASSRNLQPGQQGAVLTVRRVGVLMGSCSPHPAVKFRLTYPWAGPPVVTEIRQPLTQPAGLHLLEPYWPPAPSPVGGKQQLAFLQIAGGGEDADFSLVLWATLTPVAGGCAFSANGMLRVRCSALPDPRCSHIARRRASTHAG